MELDALERLKNFPYTYKGKWGLYISLFNFDRIFVKLADNQDRYKISDKFEFTPDWISHFGVMCP